MGYFKNIYTLYISEYYIDIRVVNWYKKWQKYDLTEDTADKNQSYKFALLSE